MIEEEQSQNRIDFFMPKLFYHLCTINDYVFTNATIDWPKYNDAEKKDSYLFLYYIL